MATLSSLHPAFAPIARWWVEYLRSFGLDVQITSTTRTVQHQAELYAEYLAGKRDLPALPPDRSLHVRGLAVDLVINGDYRGSAQAQAGQEWRRLGGEWGPSDPVHFQPPRSWREAL